MEEFSIRQFKKEDREYVRDIAWETAFRGEYASAFFDDKEILADFLTLYFTNYEPESCFVAQVDNGVVGYLIGAKSTTTLIKVTRIKIAPRLLIKFMLNGVMLNKKNTIFIFHCLLSFLKREFSGFDFSKIYPATLHINIKEGFRRLGIGSRLISTYLDYLTKEKIPGVHFATMSDKASSFFTKQGFNLLYRSRRSYFRYILHKDISVYIYGRKLH